MKFVGKICTLSLLAALSSWTHVTQAQPKPKDADCLVCHSDPTLTQEINGKQVSLHVDAGKMKQSIHGSMFGCVDCHKDIKSSPHEKTPAKVTCTQCHTDAAAAYQHSFHATARKPDGTTPATCSDCHGDVHTIVAVSDPKSPVYHTNIPATCGTCHGQKFLMESTGNSAQPFVSYQESVHGRAVESGSQTAAVCTDCHGAHDILPANNSKSLINKFNVPLTCGKCHNSVQTAYVQSIHGQAISRGNGLAPVCTDCHGIHTIKASAGNVASSSDQSLTRDSCAGCHQGVRLTQEFGLAGNRVSSYLG